VPEASTGAGRSRVDFEIVNHSAVPTEQSAEIPKPMNLREIVYPRA
jgi:hypothetical protein